MSSLNIHDVKQQISLFSEKATQKFSVKKLRTVTENNFCFFIVTSKHFFKFSFDLSESQVQLPFQLCEFLFYFL